MAGRFTGAEALCWLKIEIAVEQAIKKPEELKVAGLVTQKSWMALVYLHARIDGAAEYSWVRDHLRLDKNAMTRVVGILVDAGYITSGFHSVTGGKLLILSPNGRDAVGRLLKHASDVDFSKPPRDRD